MKNISFIFKLSCITLLTQNLFFGALVFSKNSTEEGKTLFNTKCIACHTIGQGKRLGPDLKGVTQRRKKAWLKKMIQTPDKMVKTDADAKKLLKEYNNLPMTNFGLKDKEVNALIDYLQHEDQVKK